MVKLSDVAKLVGGKVVGDPETEVNGIVAPEFAQENDITFAMDKTDLEAIAVSKAACVLTTMELDNYAKPLLCVGDMKFSMTVLYNAMLKMTPPRKGNIHIKAVVEETATIGENISIGANAVIGKNAVIGDDSTIEENCTIGDNVKVGQKTTLYANVTLYKDVVIGNNVIIHSGTVIGADGFGYIPKDGNIYKVPQLGTVIIEDNVEIGANTCIDRGTFTTTVISKGTKIDNLVQIAHNVKTGKNNLIAAQAGIAGSTIIGDNVMMGGSAGIADHVKIGANAKIGAGSGVTGNVPENGVVFGYPHREATEAKKLHGLLSIILKHSKEFRKFLRDLPEE